MKLALNLRETTLVSVTMVIIYVEMEYAQDQYVKDTMQGHASVLKNQKYIVYTYDRAIIVCCTVVM